MFFFAPPFGVPWCPLAKHLKTKKHAFAFNIKNRTGSPGKRNAREHNTLLMSSFSHRCGAQGFPTGKKVQVLEKQQGWGGLIPGPHGGSFQPHIYVIPLHTFLTKLPGVVVFVVGLCWLLVRC